MRPVLLASMLVVACHRDRANVTPQAVREAAKSSVSVAASAPPSAKAVASAHPSRDEVAELAAYKRALAAGRAQSAKKDTALAIASFTEALEHEPNDPTALGERGFAKLDSDVPGAIADLHAAVAAGGPPKLMAQIWFNLGLAHERAGDTEEAEEAFIRSNALNPTAAAKSHIKAAHSDCKTSIDRKRIQGVRAASWVALAAAVKKSAAEDEASAKRALCGAGCTGDPPWVIENATTQDGDVIAPHEGEWVYLPAAVAHIVSSGVKCPMGLPDAKLEIEGGRLVVSTTTQICETQSTSGPMVDWSMAIYGNRKTMAVWDLRRAERVLSLEWDEPEGGVVLPPPIVTDHIFDVNCGLDMDLPK